MPLLFSIGVLFAKIAAKFGVAASANTIAAGIAGTIKAVAISTAVSVGIELVNRLFRRRNEPSDAPRRTVRIEVADAVWLLGRQRVAASGVLYHGDQGRERRLRLYIAEGECEGIDGVCWIDGKRVNLVRENRGARGDILRPEPGHELRDHLEIYEYFRGDGTQGGDFLVGDPADTVYYDELADDVDESSVSYDDPRYTTQSQQLEGSGAEPFQTGMPPWTADHRVEGKSWVLVRLLQSDYGDDSNARVWSREPNIEFLVKGLKFTWPGQAAKAWTRNAAACWFWWLTERRGWSADEIDRTEFDEAYRFCGEDVDAGALPPGYTGWSTVSMRYAVDYAIASGRDAESVEEDLRAAWGGGHAVESNGKIYFRPAKEREPVAHITPSDIIGAPAVEPWRPLQERINAVNITLDQSSHPPHEHQQLNISTLRHQSAIDRDGEERVSSVRLAAVSDPIAAGRLGTIMLREADESMRQELPVMPRENLALQRLIPTDVVTVTNPEYGMDRFRMKVEGALHREDWSIVLTLREDKPATYAPTLHLPAVGERQIRIPEDGLSVLAVAGLALDEIAEVAKDGTTIIHLQADWNAATAFHTDLQVREVTDPVSGWRPPVRVQGRSHRFGGVVSGKTYEVRARHASILGRTGEWSAAVQRIIGGDLDPPGAVVMAAPVALPGGFRADLTLPSDKDFAFCQVEYQQLASDGTVAASPVKVKTAADFVEVLGLEDTTTYSVRVRAIDSSANEGAWTAKQNVTTIAGSEGVDGIDAIGRSMTRRYEGSSSQFVAGDFHLSRTQALLYVTPGDESDYLAAVEVGTYVWLDHDGTHYHYEITAAADAQLRGVDVRRFNVTRVESSAPSLTDETAYKLNFTFGSPGAPGPQGLPGISEWVRSLTVGNDLSNINHLRIQGGRFSIALLDNVAGLFPTLGNGDVGIFRFGTDSTAFKITGNGVLTTQQGTDGRSARRFSFGRYEFPFEVVSGDLPSAGTSVDVGFNAGGGYEQPTVENTLRPGTPTTFNFSKTLARTYQDSLLDVGRGDWHYDGTFAYIGWGNDSRYLRSVPTGTYFEVVVSGRKYQYRWFGNRRFRENYMRVQLELAQSSGPAYADGTTYDLKFTHVEAAEPTAETGDGVASVTQSATLSRVYEDSPRDDRFSAGDFRFQRVVGSFDQFDIAKGSGGPGTMALDSVRPGNVIYTNVEVVNRDDTTTLTELHWRVREIRNTTINGVAAITFIADPLETSGFVWEPQQAYTLKIDTTAMSSNLAPDAADREIDTVSGLDEYPENTALVRTFESSQTETHFNSNEFHYLRAGDIEAFIFAKGAEAEFLEETPVLGFLSVEIGGVDFHYQVITSTPGRYNNVAVQTFICSPVQATPPPFVDGTAYTWNFNHQIGVPTFFLDICRVLRTHQTNPSRFTATSIYIPGLNGNPTEAYIAKDNDADFFGELTNGSFLYTNISGSERDILRITGKEDVIRNGIDTVKLSVEKVDSDNFGAGRRREEWYFTYFPQPFDRVLNLIYDPYRNRIGNTNLGNPATYVERGSGSSGEETPWDNAVSFDLSALSSGTTLDMGINVLADFEYLMRFIDSVDATRGGYSKVIAEVRKQDSIYGSIAENPLYMILTIEIGELTWRTGINYLPAIRTHRTSAIIRRNRSRNLDQAMSISVSTRDLTEGVAPLHSALQGLAAGSAIRVTIRSRIFPF